MDLPRISIIIPSYNAVDSIADTLNSVINQTYINLELIVVDGKSTDGTVEVLNEFSQAINHLIVEKDQGVYAAMNKGIAVASGDFLYFLGADDVLDNPAVLQTVVNNIPNVTVKILYGDVMNLEGESARIPTIHNGAYSPTLYWKNTLHHQGTFYARSIFDDYRYDESLRILADYELNIRLYKAGEKAHKISMIVAKCKAQGLSKKFNKQLYTEELLIKKRHLSTLGFFIQIPWVWLKYLYKNF